MAAVQLAVVVLALRQSFYRGATGGQLHLGGTFWGVVIALLLVLVRTISMVELTFLTAGPTSQTLVVALHHSVLAAGVRAGQSIDAMAVIHMVTTMIWLLVAFGFVNPIQIVARSKAA